MPHYSHSEIMVIISALMLVMLLAALDQTIVSTALPRIATDLHGLNKLSWVATAYLLTSAITTPIYGKISDLFGRKKIFQTAIVIFLVGSALCGISQTMNELVIARALQGIGAGGLMSLVLAIVGDIISPRERGKYMGYFLGVFAVSSVAGPLLGGFLTDSLSWRWVFFVNLPIGVLALAAVASRLHLPVYRQEHKIDYTGAGLLSVSSVCLLLATVWGGTTYAWASTQIIGLLIASVVIALVFIFWEQKRASEPIIPMRLFRNDIFSVSVILSLLAGIAMFAAILYIPLYQQIVRGNSPTKSGLLLLPLVLGLLIASVTSGRLTSKLGRYRIFPIFGTLVLSLGLWLMSHLTLTTSEWMIGVWMAVIGIGLGSFMQIMTLAIQNSVDRSELGTATASATFFRSLGSSLGGAIFGSILISRLTYHLMTTLPQAAGAAKINISTIQTGAGLGNLQPAVAHKVFQAFVLSFHDMFLLTVPVTLLAFVVALFLRETPLRGGPREPILEEL
jgi:EmrB/QacA subfamily drug resistance transporter